ncbi:probable serine/threonine-protein kinase pats1 [Ptychodera flava]|uniref:probable serine/threonine-protein kinase pats1 n=1 Tax=Ptychodera flava TaxID=63121 RepID=UPI00396AA1C1
MLVGAYGAGKTSTKRSLFNEPPEAKHFSTDGADVYSIDITEWIIKESTTDYKGDKSIEETRKLLGDVIIHGVNRMKRDRREHQATKAEVAHVLDAVKLKGERISDTFRRLHRQSRKHVWGSQESDVYFSLWDFAGQTIYYITHQVFLASRVIYILATDLTKSLDDILSDDDGDKWTVKQFLNFWMNSIHTHASQGSDVNMKQRDGSNTTAVAPPVIILGTKKDVLRQTNGTGDGAAMDVNKEAQKRLLEIKEYLTKNATQAVNCHVVDMIAIDNMSRNEDGTVADPSVETLRLKLQQLAMEQFFLGEVPAKWIQLELSMRELRKEKISLDEVKELGKRMRMKEAEVIEALEFYHSVGEILYYKAVPELQNTIILDVEWLVNLFKILITQSITHKKKRQTPPKIISLVVDLHHEGRLHEELIDYRLKRHDRQEDKQILLKMMELYDIICELPVKFGEGRMYYLPSLMQKDAEGKNSAIFPANSSVCCQLCFHFIGNFLPEGLYYRLLIRCIRRWPNCAVVIRKHMARLYFQRNDFHLALCKEGADIQLKILVIPASDHHSSPKAKHVSKVRQLIEEDLGLVITTYTPSLVYKACFKCKCPNHRVGELLPGSEDTDDRCVPISEDRTTGICPRSAMPLKDKKLNMWYWTEGKQGKVTGRQRTSDQAFEGVDQLNELFCTLDEKLTQSDKRHMVNLLLHKQINERDAERLLTPYDVFNHLRKHGRISENNLELLKDVFRRMKRPPLLQIIDEYLQQI